MCWRARVGKAGRQFTIVTALLNLYATESTMISATFATASATASVATSTTYGAAAAVRAMLMSRSSTAGTETGQVATTIAYARRVR